MKINPKYALYIQRVYDGLLPFDNGFLKAEQSGNMDIINHKMGIAGIVVEQIRLQEPTMLKTVYNKCVKLQKQYPEYTIYIFDICGARINYQPLEYIKKHKKFYAGHYKYKPGKNLSTFTQEIQEQQKYIDNLIQCKEQKLYGLYLLNLLKKLYLSKSSNLNYNKIKFENDELYYNNKQLEYDEFVGAIK